jgi:simple sugar transport system ATP-binding protein
LDELFALSDCLYVMAKGRMSPPLARDEATVSEVGEWMSGLWPATTGFGGLHAQA